MGVLMLKQDHISELLEKHGTLKECVHCSDGIMIPSTTTYKTEYQGKILLIEDLPVFKCLENHCEKISIGTGTLKKAIRAAQINYDSTQKLIYKYKKQ